MMNKYDWPKLHPADRRYVYRKEEANRDMVVFILLWRVCMCGGLEDRITEKLLNIYAGAFYPMVGEGERERKGTEEEGKASCLNWSIDVRGVSGMVECFRLHYLNWIGNTIRSLSTSTSSSIGLTKTNTLLPPHKIFFGHKPSGLDLRNKLHEFIYLGFFFFRLFMFWK